MQSPTRAGRRLVLLACGSLTVAAMSVQAAPLADAAPACGALLLVAAAVAWYAGRRLTGTLRAAETTAARAREELQAALDNMSQGLVLCDTAANVVAVNSRFLELFGICSTRTWAGMAVADLIRLQGEAGNMTMEQADAIAHERLHRPPGASGRVVVPFRLGLLEVAYQPRPEGGWACTFEDVTAQKEAERRIAFLAHHDALTGLPNRAMMRERIEAEIAAGAPVALMFLDLDKFKLANDTFGHAVGDALLCVVSERLRASMREQDMVARMGGDEFAVLLGAPCSLKEAGRQASRLVEAFVEPLQVDGNWLRVGVSIGISFTTEASDPGTMRSTDRLLREADLALYCAKDEGRGVHRFFESATVQPPYVACRAYWPT